MKKILSIVLLIFLSVQQLQAYDTIYWDLTESEKDMLSFWVNRICKDIKQTDIPTIFIPWILASWYSEEWYNETKIKRWVPDPVTHAYDTLFKVFQDNWYILRDVYYADEFITYIKWNPKSWFYLFWYDWKKDNKVTAKILSNLVLQIREKYIQENWCDIWTVNIIWHSMWWLVARTMLSDMCASDDELKGYYNKKWLKDWQLKSFSSNFCWNYTRVNKFITIATPQRWSPGSFPVWEKWDIWQTETYVKWSVLKWQLWVFTDLWLYKIIHWFTDKIPNWIVTIWQLLPNILKNWAYNNDLLYLEKDWKNLNSKNHVQNTFLDELNNRKNLDKMFWNISGKYTQYYSEVTWNYEKNNIIWYKISDKYWNQQGFESLDYTEGFEWSDIYSEYWYSPITYMYNISENIRNNWWLWWDWTVPSKNLKLIANDWYNPEKESHKKFESKLIKCYDENKPFFTESNLTFKMWETNMELCSHSKMPTLTSIQVFENISWLKITYVGWEYSLKKEMDLLYKYIWYVDHIANSWLVESMDSDLLYKKKYIYLFQTDDKSTQDEKIKEFVDNRSKDNYERKSLEFTSWLREVIRYEVLSPINLIIEDEKGRKIWIDPETGMIVNEIPWAWTSWNTEWSNEPEFFLIPKTGTWQTLHKIHSYGTGDWVYHIVMNEIIDDVKTSSWWKIEEPVSFVIAWTATKWILENYVVWIEWDKASYKKVNSEVSDVLKKVELKEKYKDILKKLYEILDKKYSKQKKLKLKEKLIKFKELKNDKFKDNEKVNFLIDMIIEHIK